MKFWFVRLFLAVAVLSCLPVHTPAPLVYRPGEGWTYESVGGGKWRRTRAKDQLEVAQQAFDKQDYRTATKAAKRTVKTWPLSDYAPQGQYLVGRCYEARRMDERAFKEYQKALTKYPKVDNYQEILQRQFAIATRFLGGQFFRLFGYIPLAPDMDKTSDMYEKIVKNGPYSTVAPDAQMSIGKAREKQKDFPRAVKAYEKAADVYHDQKTVAADALYKAAMAYQKQAKTADYDQSVAGLSIATFSDFMTLYPGDPRGAEAQKIIATLKTEQSRGSFRIAQFYEKKKHWDGALVYYNDAIVKDPKCKYADEAKQRIDAIKKRTNRATRQS